MYTLSDQQIDFILNDIRRRGVEMEDLQSNLLDHVCCILEQNLKEGEDFEERYHTTIKSFFKRELWEIEEETITLLTFKHYYAMKKTMIVSGSIAVAALLFGSFFKVQHWPGSGPMLVLGIATISFVFLPLLLALKFRESTSARERMVVGIGTLVGILLCVSTLFKIMHWPGTTILWLSTSAVSIFLFIPLYFFTGIRKPELKMNTITTSILLVGATGLLFSLTSVRASWTIERSTFLANQDLAATYQYATEQNTLRYSKVSTDSSAAASNKALKEQSGKITSLINDLMVSLTNFVNNSNVKEIDFKSIWSAEFGNYDRPTDYLFNHADAQPKKPMMELRNAVDAYNTFIKSNYKKDSFGMINTAPTVNEKQGGTIPWEEINFYHVPFGIVLRNLIQMQVEVRTVEAACIR